MTSPTSRPTSPQPASPAPRRRSWLRALLQRLPTPRRAPVPRSTIALLSISIILPLALFGMAALQNWRDVERAAEHHVERTTRILHEHALKIFETHQLMLDQINERLRTLDWSNKHDVATLHEVLMHLQKLLPQVVDIIITDGNGHIRTESLSEPPNPATDLSDRDYFKALRAADQKLPYVSQAVFGRRTGLPIFNMAQRIRGMNGDRFDGVMVISVDQAYFGDFYRNIEHQYSQTVVLAREDGHVLASQPPLNVDTLPPSALMPSTLSEDRMGIALVRSLWLGGRRHIFGSEKVGTYPVVIGFGITWHSAFAPWWRNMMGYGLVALLSSLSLLGVSGFAIRRILLEGQATVSWRRTAALLEREIAERSRIEGQLRQAQKMEAVGQLTGGIAHDFNNLLTVVIGSLDLLSRRMKDADPRHRALIGNAIDGANRAASLTSRLLSFSRQQPLDPKQIDANALVNGMSNLLGRTLGERVAIHLRLADDLGLTFADPNQLENAILNLCVNAVDAMPDGGVLTIATANATLDEAYCAKHDGVTSGSYVAISVTDTGTGMTADVKGRAFEPFFTTKPVGKGTGLGLSQIYGFARQSGGHADIASEVGHGATIRVCLPRIEAATAVEAKPVQVVLEPARAKTLGTTVLVVEDDDLVRHFSSGALREAGYVVLEAATGLDGLQALRAHPETAMLFTDVVLKGSMNGRELADQAQALRPGLPVLFTTGYTKDAIVHGGRLDDGLNLIGKPFTSAALTSRIAGILAAEPATVPESAVA